jgi:hypothetical protein
MAEDGTKKRWKATIVWLLPDSEVERKEVEFDEVAELDDIIEGGPTWAAGLKVDISLIYQLEI